jgi:hypothetical protein
MFVIERRFAWLIDFVVWLVDDQHRQAMLVGLHFLADTLFVLFMKSITDASKRDLIVLERAS